jgi:hypothetical protein
MGIFILVDGQPDPEFPEPDSLEVHERMGEATSYRLRYKLGISEGDLPLLIDDRLESGTALSILVSTAAGPVCLVKGPVYGQQIYLQHGGAGSTLEVNGADTSITMDRENKAALWADVTDSDAVSAIVSQYGYAPDVEATKPGHPEAKHALVQRETDLQFVRRLARRNGCLFWITCDELGVETAHFRRPPLQGTPAAELAINQDPSNIEAVDITWDTERPTRALAAQLDLNTKAGLSGATQYPLTALGLQDLTTIAPEPRSLHLAAPVDDAGDLVARGEGALIDAGFFVRAKARTSLLALGAVVRAHTVVSLDGAGSRHSGAYFCASVRHSIDATAHRMEVELLRNAWGTP